MVFFVCTKGEKSIKGGVIMNWLDELMDWLKEWLS